METKNFVNAEVSASVHLRNTDPSQIKGDWRAGGNLGEYTVIQLSHNATLYLDMEQLAALHSVMSALLAEKENLPNPRAEEFRDKAGIACPFCGSAASFGDGDEEFGDYGCAECLSWVDPTKDFKWVRPTTYGRPTKIKV